MTDTPSTLRETSVEALAHGLVDLPDDATDVGVDRRPTPRMRAAVDEIRPELGPPATLLDDFTAARDDLKMQGLCAEGAHNAAWENVAFGRRYADYLADSERARESLEELRRRRDAGERLVIVSEADGGKRSHRTPLRERL
jgi:hypothetical protein